MCLMCVASLDMMKVETQENSTSTDQIMETVEVSEHHWWDLWTGQTSPYTELACVHIKSNTICDPLSKNPTSLYLKNYPSM